MASQKRTDSETSGGAPVTFRHRHLLSVHDLSRDEALALIARAETFIPFLESRVKKTDTLRGRTLINLFFENSTRTQSSFELAGKRMGADVVNMSVKNSSVAKGETLIDTAATLNAMNSSQGSNSIMQINPQHVPRQDAFFTIQGNQVQTSSYMSMGGPVTALGISLANAHVQIRNLSVLYSGNRGGELVLLSGVPDGDTKQDMYIVEGVTPSLLWDQTFPKPGEQMFNPSSGNGESSGTPAAVATACAQITTLSISSPWAALAAA